MKRIYFIVFLFVVSSCVFAQRTGNERHQHPCPPSIQQVVADLTPSQKKQLDEIMTNSAQEIRKLEISRNRIHREIRILMDKPGDQSEKIYPLFDKEATLEAKIAKKKYATKQQIDKILTPAQRKQLQSNFDAHHKKARHAPSQIQGSMPQKGPRR